MVGMQLLIAMILGILYVIDPELFDPDSLKVSKYLITLLIITYTELAVSAKRWHDRNKSAFWMLFPFISIIGQIWTIIELGFFSRHNGTQSFWQ